METPAAGGAAAPQVSISVSVLADLLAEVKQLRKEAADRDTLAAARDAQLRKEAADRDRRYCSAVCPQGVPICYFVRQRGL